MEHSDRQGVFNDAALAAAVARLSGDLERALALGGLSPAQAVRQAAPEPGLRLTLLDDEAGAATALLWTTSRSGRPRAVARLGLGAAQPRGQGQTRPA